MMNDIKKRNHIIFIAVIVLAIICSLFNGYRQINSKVSEIRTVFTSGENDDDLSVLYDLTKIDDCLSNSLSLGKLYDLDSSDYYKEVEELHSQFDSLDKIKEYKSWYEDVQEYYPLYLSEIEECDLSSTHETMLSKYEATYNSSIHTIAYSDYNDLVVEYEEDTSGLLGSMFKLLVQEVDTFD